MFTWFAQLSFAQLAWLSVIAYILHYAEEGPRLVGWFNDHYFPGQRRKIPVHYTQKKLNVENALLFSITGLNVILLNIYPDSLILQIGVLASGVGFASNTFFHVIPTLRTGIYSPGVVTASMIFPPVLVIYIWKMSQDGLLTLPVVIAALVFGLVMLPLMILFVHGVLLRDH
jgi:hypothetical protein